VFNSAAKRLANALMFTKLNVAVLLLAVGAVELSTGGAFLHQHNAMKEEIHQQHGGDAVPPVSTTMKCVINLTIQYFVLYTALAIVRTYNELYHQAPLTTSLKILEGGCTTVNYAPMLSVLFLGVRMRAVQLSGGKPDEHDLPQDWVKMAMQSCAWSVLVQTALVIAIPLVMGSNPEVGEDGDVKVEGESGIAKFFTVIRYVAMLGMYGGFSTVCVGAYMMEAPKSVYPDGPPPVSPAVACTMNLCFQYFGVYLGVAIIQTYHDFYPKGTDLTNKLKKTLIMCKNTCGFAPMLCILFIGARMRALQIDPINGNPQKWAQNCFFLCAYSVMVQLFLILMIPFVLPGGDSKQGVTEGDVTFECDNPTVLMILQAIRYAAMFALYGGFTAVIYSVCVIENPNGPTPPVSPAMQCVMNLNIQFFFVYLMLWVSITVKQFTSGGDVLDIAIQTFDSARATVMFCPMLSVLFLGLRLRALQLKPQVGAPQGWAQQGMFLCTYSLMIQVIMVLMLPLFTRSAPKTDKDGNVESPGGAGILAMTLVGLRYTCFLALYGGVITVIYALFTITPETATGTGSDWLPVPPAVPAM
jgi:hypothetical protein